MAKNNSNYSKKNSAPKVESPKVESPKVEAPKVEAPKAEEQLKPVPKAEAPINAKKAVKDVKCKVTVDFGPLFVYTERFVGKKGEDKSFPENVAVVLRRSGLVI